MGKKKLDRKSRKDLQEEVASGAGHQNDAKETLARQKARSAGNVVGLTISLHLGPQRPNIIDLINAIYPSWSKILNQ